MTHPVIDMFDCQSLTSSQGSHAQCFAKPAELLAALGEAFHSVGQLQPSFCNPEEGRSLYFILGLFSDRTKLFSVAPVLRFFRRIFFRPWHPDSHLPMCQ